MCIPTSYSLYVKGVTSHNYMQFADQANHIAAIMDHFETVDDDTMQFFVDVHDGLTVCNIMDTLAALYELGCTVHVTNV